MSEHPFGPFSGAPTPGDPLDANPEDMKICCPKCKSENFRAYTNQYGLFRSCYACKNVWSGGTAGAVADVDGSNTAPPGVAEPDDPRTPTTFGPELTNFHGDDC